jgi:hypothetical protein
MPRGKAELREYLQRCLERVERVPADEPWSQIRFPRQDAKRKIRNESQSKRIVIITDPLGFSRFHARKEAWLLELADNPSLFAEALDKAMETFDVRGFLEERNVGEQTR